MRTLSANEKFETYSSISIFLTIVLSIVLSTFSLESIRVYNKRNLGANMVGGVYLPYNLPIIIFLFRYLILTIVCVVKLVKLECGPLVKRLYSYWKT